MEKCVSRLFLFLLFFFAFLFSPSFVGAVSVNTFQVTTDGSQQKDAFVYKDLIAYDSLSDIWGFNLDTKENFPIIQRDGQQYITDLHKNLIVYQDIPPDSDSGDIRIYNIKTDKDTLIIGDPNSYSSGGTNSEYVIYLDGGACGNLYAYHMRRDRTKQIIDNVCSPKISDEIIYWGEAGSNGSDIRGYDLRRERFIDIATQENMQGSAHMFNGKIVYVDCDGCGFGTNQVIKVKDLRTNKVTTIYETTTKLNKLAFNIG